MIFAQFVEWAFYGIVGGSMVYGVTILGNMKKSIDDLNAHVVRILEKTAWHEKWLQRHDDEISNLKK